MDVWIIADDDHGEPGKPLAAHSTRRAALERVKRDEWYRESMTPVLHHRSRKWRLCWRFTWVISLFGNYHTRAVWLIKMDVED